MTMPDWTTDRQVVDDSTPFTLLAFGLDDESTPRLELRVVCICGYVIVSHSYNVEKPVPQEGRYADLDGAADAELALAHWHYAHGG